MHVVVVGFCWRVHCVELIVVVGWAPVGIVLGLGRRWRELVVLWGWLGGAGAVS